MKKILYILTLSITLIVIVVYSLTKKPYAVEEVKTETVLVEDIECENEDDVYYNPFEGQINNEMSIKLELSCDHNRVNITGSVNQEIVRFKKNNRGESQESELVVNSSGLSFDEDYNFDGYNDISTLYNYGAGYMALYDNYYFLYDPLQNKFIFNKELSDLQNLVIKSTSTKTLEQVFNMGPDLGYSITEYKWKGDKLIKIGNRMEKYNDSE